MDWLDSLLTYETPDFSGSHWNGPAEAAVISHVEHTLAEYERLFGFAFPASYKAFLEAADGGVIRDVTEDAVLALWDEEASGPIDDYEACVTFLACDGELRPSTNLLIYNTPDWLFMDEDGELGTRFMPLVFFAMDEHNKFWAFDWALCGPDGEMPVVYCDDETGHIYPQAVNFQDFVEQLIERKLFYRHHIDCDLDNSNC